MADDAINRYGGGKSVLVVEDEWLMSDALADALDAAGHRTIGPAADISYATALLSGHRPDLALVDYRLRTVTTEPLLQLLRELAVPAVVMTGYDANHLPASCRDHRILFKPFGIEKLLAVVDMVI